MEIYILRHGIAEEISPAGGDAARALTAEGKKRLREVLKLAARGMRPDGILCSPYRRAIESARIAAEVLAFPGDILTSESFMPMSSPEDAWEEIRLYRDSAAVLIATHEPLAGLLAAFLLNSPSLAVEVKTGTIICVDAGTGVQKPRGILKWMLSPTVC
ncbi:MAG: histidine phosphatase family protein [Candidatus Solibacter usitatus]|nr:histidine phosphatase family protein [Candidatus Solibacter usitatus]